MESFAMEEAEQLAKEDAASRLTYEIFSILETKFLFGCGGAAAPHPSFFDRAPAATTQANNNNNSNKVCVLSIDGGARPADGLLAAAALVRLEAALRRRANNKDARLPDFFDVAAGSGAGGVLAAMLFARGPRGRPMYSAHDALAFLLRRVRRGWWSHRSVGLLPLRRRSSAFEKVFGDLTLRDTVRPVLVPCYDLATRAPLLFSRAAAADSPAHDFHLRDVCAATCAGGAAVEVASVDGATRVAAAGGGGAALGNPTAAAITHVLNNKREFPGAAGVGDLLVLSVGTGDGGGTGGSKTLEVARIASEGVSDMVDQAVAMAFGHSRTSNYVRIQGTGSRRAGAGAGRGPRMACGGEPKEQAAWKAEAMLLQKSVESVLFQGRRLAGETNAEKIERFARELVKEHARRKQQLTAASPNAEVQLVPVTPSVALKQQPTANPCGSVRVPSSEAIIKQHQPVAVKQQPTTNPSSGVLVPSSAAIMKQRPAPAQNVAVAAATSAIVTTEPATAAAQVPVPRRRRRTPVRTVVATTKRATGTSSSSRGARKRTL